MTTFRDGSERGPLSVALNEYVAGAGARMAALVDRSGGLLAHTGFPGAGKVADLAALTAGLHAYSRRMGELTGSGTVEQMVALGGAGRVAVQEMPSVGKSVLLLTVFERQEDDSTDSQGTERLAGALTRDRPSPPRDEALEASLLAGLDRALAAE